MKGKLILVPVKEPKEGMKVVFENDINPRFIDILHHIDFDGKIYLRHCIFSTFTNDQLKQIAIEYDDWDNNFGKTVEFKATILLSLDNYEKALPLIGQEVEFNQIPLAIREDQRVYQAKLITSSPIVYTEEEAKRMVKYAFSFAETKYGTWEDYWNKNKKK